MRAGSIGGAAAASMPRFGAAAWVWARIGMLSFGGPAGQIAMLHREVVEARGWVGERRFLHALSFCALLPGPEAQQLATYLGWLMHGPAGGLVAGTLFVLPGAVLLLGLSILFFTLGQVPAVGGVFYGLQCAVLALVVQAVWRMGNRALKTPAAYVVAAAAFCGLALVGVPFPVVVLGAGVFGALRPGWFRAAGHGAAAADERGVIEAVLLADPGRVGRMAAASRRAAALCALLWLVPVAVLRFGAAGRFADIAWFFSKMAVVTLGGAYAVLAYVAQDAVHVYHWLSPADMIAGLGLAETTPGPLILVLQFVGFLAGARAPGGLHGVWGGVVASGLTLWVTFLPCFTFVFLGAPVVERLVENRILAAALAAVTASVVGVIGNLAVFFAGAVLSHGGRVDWAAGAWAGFAGVLLLRWRLPVPVCLGVCALAGMFWRILPL